MATNKCNEYEHWVALISKEELKQNEDLEQMDEEWEKGVGRA
jgi:hypothetical protein